LIYFVWTSRFSQPGAGFFFRATEFKPLLDDPPLCFPSVLSFSWDLHLNFSPNIETIGQANSAQKPNSDSRHLYAGNRLGSGQTGILSEDEFVAIG
jgi:hypothetical protein